MDGIKVGNASPTTVYEFYLTQQPVDRAINYRLYFAQRERDNHETLEIELPNILNIVSQVYDKKDWVLIAAFQNALQNHLNLRGYWEECITLNKWGCEAAQVLGDQLSLARWTHDRGDILNQEGQYAKAEILYEAAEKVYLSLDHSFKALESRHMRSIVLRAQGNILKAKRINNGIIKEALVKGLGDWLPHPCYVQALLSRDLGMFSQAHETIRYCLTEFKYQNDLTMIAHCHHFMGELMLLQGEINSEVESQLLYSLQLSEQTGILRRIPATLRLIGDLYRFRGEYQKAKAHYNKALETSSRIGDKPQTGRLLVSEAQLNICLGNLEDAVQSLQGARTIYQELGDPRWMAGIAYLISLIYFKQGRYLLAFRTAIKGIWVALSDGLLHPKIIIGTLKRGLRI